MNLTPMLAKPFHERYIKNLDYVYIQPKLDGQRAIYWKGRLYSRTGKEILNCPHIIDECEKLDHIKYPLDGELYIHGKSLQEIISNTRKTVNLEENKIEYHIYDIINKDRYDLRHLLLNNTLGIFQYQYRFLKCVETKCNSGKFGHKAHLDPFSKRGYEGSIVRLPDGLYEPKRSSNLLKIKSFVDGEFKVIGITQLFHKEKVIVPNGTPGSKKYADGRSYKDGAETPARMMGSLILENTDGTSFEVGTGFSDELRKLYWERFEQDVQGKMVTIKYQKLTDGGTPFLPVFKCIRDYE